MTIWMWAEFATLIAVVVAVSYAGARFDIYCMQRQARKQAERQRLLDVLRRAE
jgi:hypothetical protein